MERVMESLEGQPLPQQPDEPVSPEDAEQKAIFTDSKVNKIKKLAPHIITDVMVKNWFNVDPRDRQLFAEWSGGTVSKALLVRIAEIIYGVRSVDELVERKVIEKNTVTNLMDTIRSKLESLYEREQRAAAARAAEKSMPADEQVPNVLQIARQEEKERESQQRETRFYQDIAASVSPAAAAASDAPAVALQPQVQQPRSMPISDVENVDIDAVDMTNPKIAMNEAPDTVDFSEEDNIVELHTGPAMPHAVPAAITSPMITETDSEELNPRVPHDKGPLRPFVQRVDKDVCFTHEPYLVYADPHPQVIKPPLATDLEHLENENVVVDGPSGTMSDEDTFGREFSDQDLLAKMPSQRTATLSGAEPNFSDNTVPTRNPAAKYLFPGDVNPERDDVSMATPAEGGKALPTESTFTGIRRKASDMLPASGPAEVRLEEGHPILEDMPSRLGGGPRLPKRRRLDNMIVTASGLAPAMSAEPVFAGSSAFDTGDVTEPHKGLNEDSTIYADSLTTTVVADEREPERGRIPTPPAGSIMPHLEEVPRQQQQQQQESGQRQERTVIAGSDVDIGSNAVYSIAPDSDQAKLQAALDSIHNQMGSSIDQEKRLLTNLEEMKQTLNSLPERIAAQLASHLGGGNAGASTS